MSNKNIDSGMFAKGYRWRINSTTHPDKTEAYAKRLVDIGPLVRELFPEDRIEVTFIGVSAYPSIPGIG